MQNLNLNLRKGEIVAKFTYVTKKMNRNLVVEVGADTRKILLQRKIKIGWQICRIEDYLVANRCFKCSRFNHRHRDLQRGSNMPFVDRPSHVKGV